MKAWKVDEKQLAEWIDGATGEIRYLGPGITEILAQKLLAAEQRTGQRNHVVIDLNDEMDRIGYGKTAGVRKLHNEGASIRSYKGLRIAALTAPGIGVVWSPIAERVDPIKPDLVKPDLVNGIWMEGPEQLELRRWIDEMIGGQYEPVTQVTEKNVKQVEKHLHEHPPRDFRQEQEVEVYQGYVGFIEIHVIGASLSEATTLAIPKELTELGLTSDLRNRISEKMRIDLSDSVDLGASDVNQLVDAFRKIFTQQMGQPLGRIYRKSEWDVMKNKWAEIERLVEEANKKIQKHMHTAVEKIIKNAAEEWAKAIRDIPNPAAQGLTADKIELLLNEQWDRKQRATSMKVQLFPKDLTWETLNDPEVRKKIEETYPDLRDTGLYTRAVAHGLLSPRYS